MQRFRVEVIAKTPNPQQVIYAAMHQDYTDAFVVDERDSWPSESQCGEVIVKRLLAGERGHYGPLEHPQIVFNCGYFPHSVMQQARTHRVGVSFDVQCLSANTEITFVNCKGEANQKLKKTIGELYDLWTNGEKAIRLRSIRGRNGELPGEYRRDCKKRLRRMHLRVLNEETGLFEVGHIQDVMCSGIQPVYRLTLEDGKTLDCTVNHRLFTSEGWQTMGDAVGLVTNDDGSVVKMTKQCNLMCNGLTVVGKGLYTSREWLETQISKGLSTLEIAQLSECSVNTVRSWAARYGLSLNHKDSQFPKEHKPWNYNPDQSLAYDFNNLVTVCKNCHEDIHQNNQEAEFAQSYNPVIDTENWQAKPKSVGKKLRAHPVKVKDLEYLGQQMTYDLEVEGDWHNFVANGVVVHNSFRYTGNQFIQVLEGKKDIEDVFYLRPVGHYTDRQGKKYYYSPEQRAADLEWCREAAKRYADKFQSGMSEEHARGIVPFDYRQHFVVSFNVRSFLHFCDLRNKKDAQLEIQKLCELMWPHFAEWAPAIAIWYEKQRLGKARLAP
ncbi:FAD-dependent thymidylate synthase [Nostoc sp. FACHB-110]|nr:FAD-dependent thymidylate synthase [Nostoc sp. FACHB-110]